MRVVAMANGGFALPSLQAIKESRHELVALIAMPVRTKKKGDKAGIPPVRKAAETFLSDTPLFDPEDVNSPEGVELVRKLSADVIFICDFGKILSKEVLTLARYGGLNLHGSLLPKYRGAAPINRSLQAGEREVGVSVIFIEPKVDAGPVVKTASYRPSLDDTAVEVEDYLAKVGAPLIVEALDEIETGTIKSLPQRHEQATKAPKLRKEEGRIDWRKTSVEIIDQYRAFQPWPRTYADWISVSNSKETRLILGPFSLKDFHNVEYQFSEGADSLEPGTVLSATKDGLWVKTGDGALRVVAVQPAGKKLQPAEAFILGYPVQKGDVFK